MGCLFEIDNVIGYVAVIAIIIAAAKCVGLVFKHFGLPEVLGFIISGIIIGPAIFGDFCGFTIIGENTESYYALFAVDDDMVISVFSKIGVLLLMFSAGLETNLEDIKKTGLVSALVAVMGVAVPLVLGFLISLPFSNIGLGIHNIYRCVFVGTILTATSVAITVSVLKELGKINTKLGTTIVSAAIIDDVIGIVVLSIVTGIAKSGTDTTLTGFEYFKSTIYGTIIMIVAFFIVAIALGWCFSKLFRWMGKRWPHTHRLPILSLALCFFYSFLAEEVFGVADITGAFLAGVVLSTAHRETAYIDKKLAVVTYTIFAPIFFANIGISNITFANINGSVFLFALIVVILGLLGKIIGCGGVCKAAKYSWRESAIGGVGMMARGEVALIVTATVTDVETLGNNALGPEFMIMTVLLILVSAI